MNTKPFTGNFDFTSPINQDNGYTVKNLVKETKSTMDITINEDGTGHVIWDIDELDMEECIGLWFNENELTDYDGVFDLPEQLITFLTNQGYNMAWAE